MSLQQENGDKSDDIYFMLSSWHIVGFQQMFTAALIVSIIIDVDTVFFKSNVMAIRIFLLRRCTVANKHFSLNGRL